MKQHGKIEVLRQHENATWNVWTEHKARCAACALHARTRNMGLSSCPEGLAAWDEWCIASRRHLDTLR